MFFLCIAISGLDKVINKKSREKYLCDFINDFNNYLVISLPITNLWISEVPSPMVQSLESL